MPTESEAAEWIMKGIFKGAYNAAGAALVDTYHQDVLHEQELVEAGMLNNNEPFRTNRRKLAESIDPELRARIDKAHAKLPKHRFLP